MKSGYIIAAFLWAIVCAGYTHEILTVSEEPQLSHESQPTIVDSNVTVTTATVDQTVSGYEQADTQQITTTSLSLTVSPIQVNRAVSSVQISSSLNYTTSSRSPMTTKKPATCMDPRREDFLRCLENLGKNAMPYILHQKLPEFLDELCNENGSKPDMECLQRHFSECPDFLQLSQVAVLQFGPYHIRDIRFFSSMDQMCSCITGLACIQELIKVKKQYNLTLHSPDTPWVKMPNFKVICEYGTERYIGCVRGNLRVCQSPLTKRYGEDFTNDDAEDIKELYDFTKEHCDTINSEGFTERYSCLEKTTVSDTFKECVQSTTYLSTADKVCKLRECVAEHLEDECDDDDLIQLYIDAVNVYRWDSVKLLSKPCSNAAEIGISIATVVVAIAIVFMY